MIITSCGIQFAVKNSKVYLKGRELHISDRAHKCLIEFLKSDNSTLTKDFLMNKIWEGVIVSDDSVFKLIQEVRKCLKQFGINNSVIKNVYGKGYQWVEPIQVASEDVSSPKPLKWVFFVIASIVVLAGLWWSVSYNKYSDFDDTKFQSYLDKINHGQGLFVLNQLPAEMVKKNDQLKLSYLKGLIHYKAGDYESSINILRSAVEEYKGSDNILADSYLLLAKMFVYRDDKQALKQYIDYAQEHYQKQSNSQGLIDTSISRARYHQVMLEYETSIMILNELLNEAQKNEDLVTQTRVYSNLAYSYEQTSQQNKQIEVLEKSLELALKTADGRYASYSYGALSEIYSQQGDLKKAGKYAEMALHFILNQKDTNVFQQGFSYFYNMLDRMGHTELAEIYLQKGIDVQNHFNSEGVLILAEMNLARVKIRLKKYAQSRDILQELLKHDLNEVEAQEIASLRALVSYFMNDDIGAYTNAKNLYLLDGTNTAVRVSSGVTYAIASHNLERYEESQQVLMEIVNLLPNLIPVERKFYIELIIKHIDTNDLKIVNLESLKSMQRQAHSDYLELKSSTQPTKETLLHLDQYLLNITNS